MLIPDGFAQVNFKFTGLGLPYGAECTLGINHEGVLWDPTEVAENIITDWDEADMNVCMSASVTLSSVLVKFGPNATGPAAEVAAGIVGTQTTPVVANTAYLIHKNTASGGRTGRGRMYLPGIPESVLTGDGIIDASYIEDNNEKLADFEGKLVADELGPALLHAEGSPVTTPTVITSLEFQPKAATQRRRLRR